MTPSNREHLSELLSAYLDEELTASERAEIEARLADDAEARQLLIDLRGVCQALRAFPIATAPPSLQERIAARLKNWGSVGQSPNAGRKLPLFWPVMGMAAALLVVVGVTLYYSANESFEKPSAVGQQALPNLREPGPREDADGLSSLGYASKPTGEKKMAMRRMSKGDPAGRSQAGTTDDEYSWAADDSTRENALDAKGKAENADLYASRDAISVPHPAAPGEASRGFEQTGAADARTLEQKLAMGEDLSAVTVHDFSNEPLQLRLVFAEPAQRDRFEEELTTFLESNQVQPVQRVLESRGRRGKPARRQPMAAEEESVDPEVVTPVYYEGSSVSNFSPQEAGRRKILVRIPAEPLNQLIDVAATEEAEQIELDIGMLKAEGAGEVQQLARQALEPGVSGEAALTLGVETYDLMDVLSQFGMAPPETPDAESAPSEHKSKERSVGDADASFAEPDESRGGAARQLARHLYTLVIDLASADRGSATQPSSPTPKGNG